MHGNDCIFYLLSRSARRSARFYKKQLEGLGLTPVQSMVLQALALQDGCTTSQLSKASELDNATLTGVLDRLSPAGYLERRASPEDRRTQHILLTEQGRSIASLLDSLTEDANSKFLSGLNDDDKDELKAFLRRF
ncbi:Organic hydroperoxide resistance transcriptional regulator [Pseudovibrio axinellae]|uniref:Organic hydroperoxide resistance transcriptional regulator n=1 Tax=Pseudovibrio axinellae TaxID=989403 RepID=A0A165Z5B9_9HYPH|nr:MarR family transcriptional regulator [Pseudovibrio axinellae]KZL19523.1 Organic hydroperoxide resistance transcriptional regulator [Pseudovibrio axinellae]SEQ30369.1 transcriptional regulator, MarR family [Pseudovibrio axinellae]